MKDLLICLNRKQDRNEGILFVINTHEIYTILVYPLCEHII